MRRRRFLAALALAPALAAAGCRSKNRGANPVSNTPTASPPRSDQAAPVDGCQVARRDARSARVLTPPQWDALEAACERLLPRDTDPGASDADVVNFIDAQLVYPPYNSFSPLIQAGAQELDRLAGAGQRFSELPGDEQDRLLTALQRSTIGRHSGARFFEVLLTLTLEGFFSDPIYGGNRDRVGWRMIKLVPRSPGARCAYPGLG